MQKRKEKYTKFCLNLQMGMEETWKESKRHERLWMVLKKVDLSMRW